MYTSRGARGPRGQRPAGSNRPIGGATPATSALATSTQATSTLPSSTPANPDPASKAYKTLATPAQFMQIASTSAFHLKRFTRKPQPGNDDQQTGKESGAKLVLNTRIREYFNRTAVSTSAPAYVSHREIPTSEEISVSAEGEDLEVPANIVVGPWESKRKYLTDHYALLREDAVTPLRNVVSEMKADPCVLEKDSMEHSYIYEQVFIVGLTFAHSGIAAKVTFSLRRSGKKVLWEQSKRLVQGTLIALSPANDMFKNICKVGVVAARPLSGVQSNPPEIDIFFGSPDEIEIDPQQEWVMVESSIGYFEAYRHTLSSLQKMGTEPFPMAEYIVGIERDITPPWYLGKQPFKDLSSAFPGTGDKFSHIDLLDGHWPEEPTSDLDASQLEALRRILTKELAIVQGPPGTGKTYVSVLALKVLLQNKRPDDAPVIVAAHTNHALDQLLRHIAEFESNFIRLGSMTLDQEIIQPRTLFKVKEGTKLGVLQGGMKGPALGRMRRLVKEMQELVKPLTVGEPFTEELFKAYGVLTHQQCELLVKGANSWVDLTLPDSVTAAISKWAGDELVQADRRTMPESFGFDYEEMDLEFEQLKELEAEAKLSNDDEFEGLRGEQVRFDEPLTGRWRLGRSNEELETLLKNADLWDIPIDLRGPLYRHMQQRVKQQMVQKMRGLAKEYDKQSKNLKIGKWEYDTNFLQASNIIGCTTTGLSKYRGLLDSLKPKVVLIEEAAETLEAYVTAACFTTLEHLVLVGDHQQLRGHCNEPELEGKPFFLDVSMFERLVRNQVEFTQLTRQRRMHPEIRRGLMPIYPNLEDHPSVFLRDAVPGMGDIRSFLFCHDWREDHDDLMSKINRREAVMVVGFYNYLVTNGVKTKDITVLTFYNGQRKLIMRGLRMHPNLQGERFKVVTVDSYQGEENGIVLLSLARSNDKKNIGFLSVANRICVALSRAQRGFYLFGNARMICKESVLWFKLLQAMAENPRRVGFHLPLTCQTHGIKTYAKDPDRFNDDAGGCEQECRGELPCGHICELNCHPAAHEDIICYQPCIRELECGHQCNEQCHVPCKCPCDRKDKGKQPIRNPVQYSTQRQSTYGLPTRASPTKTPRGSPPKIMSASHMKRAHQHPQDLIDLSPEAQGYRDFAAGGHKEADAAALAMANEAAAKERLRQLDEENAALLFGGPLESSALLNATNELTLTSTKQGKDGVVRNTYEGFFKAPEIKTSKLAEPSLLD